MGLRYAALVDIQLHCQCGAIQGDVDSGHAYGRAVCYCKDCQAYARFLGARDEVLNAHGGTEILAVHPRAVRLTAGLENLACMSLSDKGILRWYASCCRSPIGNTPRNATISYLGLVRTCVPDLDDKSVGPLRIALNTSSATGNVKATPFATFFGVIRILRNIIGARLTGKYRQNPFFEAGSGAPVKTPRVLAAAERQSLYDAA